jgi:hypothetical protein
MDVALVGVASRHFENQSLRALRNALDDAGLTSRVIPNGQTLPAQIRDCLITLFAGYCYPSLAGMTRSFTTCHNWIA